MKQAIKIVLLSAMTLSFSAFAKPVVDLYKSPVCGCCKEWAAIMESKGYQVDIKDIKNWASVRREFAIPNELKSCHSAVIDGYMIEGHVPETDIARLLKEKPENVSGIAVAGMPQYAPGMAAEGQLYKGFDVIAFAQSGKTTVYESY